jgi:hypothetical protein
MKGNSPISVMSVFYSSAGFWNGFIGRLIGGLGDAQEGGSGGGYGLDDFG